MPAMDVEQCYKCEFCTLKLENYHLWCQHLRELHNIVFVQCEYCNAQLPSKSELRKHVKSRHTNGRNPRVECSRCPSTFLSLKSLENHINRKHNQMQSPTFTCKKCDKKYKNTSSLRSHQKTHLPLSYIKCDQCPKVFHNKQTLNTHKNVDHSSNYQRAQCSLCPASYKYRTYLSRHMRYKHFSDTIDTPSNDGTANSVLESDNKCNICSAHFPNKTTLLEHRKTFHNRCIDIFSCGQCTAVFKIREAYENHLQEEHRTDPEVECDLDNKNYIFQEYVDFETAMLQNFELRQLMAIRKSHKFSQKLVIVTYRRDSDYGGNKEPDDSELNEILPNISSFFETLVSHYRVDQMTEVKDLPVQICLNDPQIEDNHSEVAYFEFGAPNDPQPPIQNDEEIQVNEHFGADKIVNTSEEAKELTHDATDEITQNEAHSTMQIPKIMFNCLECTDLFPDEDKLWSHLTKVHKKTIKRPVTLKDSECNEASPQPINLRTKKTIAAKIMRQKRNDAQYIIKQNNKQFNENVVRPNRNINSKPYTLKRTTIRKKNLTKKKIITRSDKKNSAIEIRAKINKELKNINKCNTCKKSFKLKALLVRHINYTHKNNKLNITNYDRNKDKLQLQSIEEMPKNGTKSNKKYVKANRQLRVKPISQKSNVLKIKFNLENNKVKKSETQTDSNLKNKENLDKEISKNNSESKKDKVKLMYPCKYCHALFPCIELLVNHISWQHNY